MRFGHGFRSPTGSLWEGVYIDDHATVGILRADSRQADLDSCRSTVLRSEVAYTDVGLTRHPGKEVRDKNKATLWGTTVDGPRRVARSDADKVSQVIGLTALTILEGWCTGRVLRRLAGLWVHHLLMRRPYLCLLQETFAVAEAARPWKKMRLPYVVAEELCLCCLLAGEAVAPLDARYRHESRQRTLLFITALWWRLRSLWKKPVGFGPERRPVGVTQT
jgi:hypothetical protein